MSKLYPIIPLKRGWPRGSKTNTKIRTPPPVTMQLPG